MGVGTNTHWILSEGSVGDGRASGKTASGFWASYLSNGMICATNNPIKKKAKDINRHFQKKTYMQPTSMR